MDSESGFREDFLLAVWCVELFVCIYFLWEREGNDPR